MTNRPFYGIEGNRPGAKVDERTPPCYEISMTQVNLIEIPDEGYMGPAMKALPSDRMRAFVIACNQPSSDGSVNYSQAARNAGYSDTTPGSIGVQAHRLAHDERIQAAMLEEAQRRMGAALPLATAAVVQIMTQATKNSERLKAAAMIFNRAGMSEKTEHTVTVTRTETPEQKIERAIRLAKELGLDPKQILGNVGIALPKELTHSSTLEFAPVPVGTLEGLEDFL